MKKSEPSKQGQSMKVYSHLCFKIASGFLRLLEGKTALGLPWHPRSGPLLTTLPDKEALQTPSNLLGVCRASLSGTVDLWTTTAQTCIVESMCILDWEEWWRNLNPANKDSPWQSTVTCALRLLQDAVFWSFVSCRLICSNTFQCPMFFVLHQHFALAHALRDSDVLVPRCVKAADKLWRICWEPAPLPLPGLQFVSNSLMLFCF